MIKTTSDLLKENDSLLKMMDEYAADQVMFDYVLRQVDENLDELRRDAEQDW